MDCAWSQFTNEFCSVSTRHNALDAHERNPLVTNSYALSF